MAKKLQVDLTGAQKEFLSNCLGREFFRIKRLKQADQERAESKATISLVAKVSDRMSITRIEARVLQRVTENWILISRTLTLPEYDRRVSLEPANLEKYAPYQRRLESELEAAIELADKIKELI